MKVYIVYLYDEYEGIQGIGEVFTRKEKAEEYKLQCIEKLKEEWKEHNKVMEKIFGEKYNKKLMDFKYCKDGYDILEKEIIE